MKANGWIYYNRAALPTVSPKDEPDTAPVRSGEIWKTDGHPLLARWTTAFDCGCETEWWYVVKDTPFDIAQLKAKRRYEINKGSRFFDVRRISAGDYKNELYLIQVAAFSVYPKKYRPSVDKAGFFAEMESCEDVVFGAFFRETGRLAGYARLSQSWADVVSFSVLKTDPEYEKYAVNAALVEKILSHYADFLSAGGLICDGERSISHETHFQDYLEKYFGFRKAYCRLHVAYNPKIRWAVKLLYPFRGLLGRLDCIRAVHPINAVIRMEEICRRGARPAD